LADTAWVFVALVNRQEEGEGGTPTTFSLRQNHPNPFSEATIISYELLQSAFVELQVFALNGQLVTTLVNENQPVGSYRFSFAAPHLSAGVYFYRMRTSSNLVDMRKMIYLKERV
jgi:hypothetical protein